MNVITITGNIGRDCETRFLPNGDPVASFSVADSQGRDKPSIWWSASLFGKRAQSLAPYLTKGQQVTVVGTITEREWTDKDGHKRKSMDIRVQDLALQGGKRDDAPQAAPQHRTPAPATGAAPFEDDIPFAPLKHSAI